MNFKYAVYCSCLPKSARNLSQSFFHWNFKITGLFLFENGLSTVWYISCLDVDKFEYRKNNWSQMKKKWGYSSYYFFNVNISINAFQRYNEIFRTDNLLIIIIIHLFPMFNLDKDSILSCWRKSKKDREKRLLIQICLQISWPYINIIYLVTNNHRLKQKFLPFHSSFAFWTSNANVAIRLTGHDS